MPIGDKPSKLQKLNHERWLRQGRLLSTASMLDNMAQAYPMIGTECNNLANTMRQHAELLHKVYNVKKKEIQNET